MKLTMRPATTVLLLISVLFTLAGSLPGFEELVILGGSFIPARIFGDLAEYGDVASLLPVWITPFTAPFVHLGILDLLFPSLMLLLLGNLTEAVLGWKGILVLYFAGALASAIAILVVVGNLPQPFSGSRNVVATIIAAYLILHPVAALKQWGNLSPHMSRMLQLLFLWLMISLAMNLGGPAGELLANTLSSVASFAVGMLLARPLLRRK
jgi:membrane associated rhomboid family serine protease